MALPETLKVVKEEGEMKDQDHLEVGEVYCRSTLQEREAWYKVCQEEGEEQKFQVDWDLKVVLVGQVAEPIAAAAVVA